MPKICIEKNLTPLHLRCSAGSCPGVHRLSDGNLIVVGKVAPSWACELLSEEMGSDEVAIIIDPAYFIEVPQRPLPAPPLKANTVANILNSIFRFKIF